MYQYLLAIAVAAKSKIEIPWIAYAVSIPVVFLQLKQNSWNVWHVLLSGSC